MRKVNASTFKADEKQEREFQIIRITHSSDHLLNDRSTHFLEDELADEPMEVLDLY